MTDKTIVRHVCLYCGRPAKRRWPSGSYTCGVDPCDSLAYSHEVGFDEAPYTHLPPTDEQLLDWAVDRARATVRRAEELDRAYDARWAHR